MSYTEEASGTSLIISIEDFPLICRVCLRKGQLVPIFYSSIMHDNVQVLKVDWLLKECAKLEVMDDDLPKNICVNCLMQLMEIYNFHRKCYVNNLNLQQLRIAVAMKQEYHQKSYFFDTNELIDHTYVKIEDPPATEEADILSESNENNQSFDYTLLDNSQSIIEPENNFIDPSMIAIDEDPVNELDENSQESIISTEDVDLSRSDNNYEALQEFEFRNQNPSVLIRTVNRKKVPSENLICRIFVCKECSVRFPTFEKMRAHQIEAQHAKNFYTRQRLVPNRRGDQVKRRHFGNFNCKSCLKTFSTFNELRIHRKEARHPIRHSVYPCEVCGKLLRKGRLELHMRSHTKERPYKCSSCDLAFTIKANLTRHEVVHTGEKPFVCEVCGSRFTQSSSLLNHQKQKHSEDSEVKSDANVPLWCSICGYEFKRLGSLNLHMRKMHPTEIDEQKSVKKEEPQGTYVCDKCGKCLNSKSQFKEHKKRHRPPIPCHVCGKLLSSKVSLATHMRTHTGEKPYVCSFCSKSFIQNANYVCHLRTHTGVKPFKCTECPKTFTQRTHLIYHRRVHSGERPYSCEYCGKAFALKGNLTVHIRTHTGETPYHCKVCDRGFYDSSSRNKHQQSH